MICILLLFLILCNYIYFPEYVFLIILIAVVFSINKYASNSPAEKWNDQRNSLSSCSIFQKNKRFIVFYHGEVSWLCYGFDCYPQGYSLGLWMCLEIRQITATKPDILLFITMNLMLFFLKAPCNKGFFCGRHFFCF